MMTLEDALYAYHEAEAARRLAIKLVNQAGDDLLHVLGVPLRATTLRFADDGSRRLGKRDVDTLERLSPSQRRKLRLLKTTTKGI